MEYQLVDTVTTRRGPPSGLREREAAQGRLQVRPMPGRSIEGLVQQMKRDRQRGDAERRTFLPPIFPVSRLNR